MTCAKRDIFFFESALERVIIEGLFDSSNCRKTRPREGSIQSILDFTIVQVSNDIDIFGLQLIFNRPYNKNQLLFFSNFAT